MYVDNLSLRYLWHDDKTKEAAVDLVVFVLAQKNSTQDIAERKAGSNNNSDGKLVCFELSWLVERQKDHIERNYEHYHTLEENWRVSLITKQPPYYWKSVILHTFFVVAAIIRLLGALRTLFLNSTLRTLCLNSWARTSSEQRASLAASDQCTFWVVLNMNLSCQTQDWRCL